MQEAHCLPHSHSKCLLFQVGGEYPPRDGMGYPPHPRLGNPPIQGWIGVPPHPRLDWGTPPHPRLGYPPPSKVVVPPHPRLDQGTPPLSKAESGTPPQIGMGMDRDEVPPPPSPGCGLTNWKQYLPVILRMRAVKMYNLVGYPSV